MRTFHSTLVLVFQLNPLHFSDYLRKETATAAYTWSVEAGLPCKGERYEEVRKICVITVLTCVYMLSEKLRRGDRSLPVRMRCLPCQIFLENYFTRTLRASKLPMQYKRASTTAEVCLLTSRHRQFQPFRGRRASSRHRRNRVSFWCSALM